MPQRAESHRLRLGVACAALLGGVWLAPAMALAHPLSFGSVRLERQARELRGDLVLDVPDAVLASGDTERERELSSQLLSGFRLEVDDTTAAPELRVRALGHGASAVDVVEVRFGLPEHFSRVRLVTSEAVGDVAVEWADPATGFRSRALVPAGERSPWVDFVVKAPPRATATAEGKTSAPDVRAPAVAPSRTLRDYLALGFGHIIPGGTDHLLFVASLALLVERMRSLLLLVTGFTLGHAVSLGLSLAGWASASAAWVEPLIALSLAYGALEWRFRSAEPLRPFVVVGFGLIHGLGFAGALARISVPEDERVAALIGFNVGVELGQLLGAFAVVLLLAGLDRRFEAKRLRAGSLGVIGAIGLAWAVLRLFSPGA